MDVLKNLLIAAAAVLSAIEIEACYNRGCQVTEPCEKNADCALGLFCSTCNAAGDPLKRCHRNVATDIASIKAGLPFNKYSWLVTHNSYSIIGTPPYPGSQRETFLNQEDNVSDQLNNGVRGLMLDMYDFMGDIWLCHSFGGICYPYTAFRPAIDTLKEIEAFLYRNPTQIITIFIEDYVHAKEGLTKIIKAAGLDNYMFPLVKMPINGGDWPTITEMVTHNERLLVFSSDPSKELEEAIPYQWNFINENQYGNAGIEEGDCPRRGESAALSNRSRSLILQNFFPDEAVEEDACLYNSQLLRDMLQVCHDVAGRRWPNFLAVDFYKRSTGGGAFEAVDILNGVCKPNQNYGACTSTMASDVRNSQPLHVHHHPSSFSTHYLPFSLLIWLWFSM